MNRFRPIRFRISPALFILMFWSNAWTRQQTPCDSLAAARRYYLRADFEKARSLLNACKTPDAYELLALIAFKQDNLREAEQFLCTLLKSKSDYNPAPAQAPRDFAALVEKVRARKECRPDTAGKPQPLIQPETNILGWMKCNVGYGRIFGDGENDERDPERRYFPTLAHFRLGFEKAEIEFRSIDIKNDVEQLKDQLLILAFKVQIVPEGTLHRRFPAVTAHVRTTVADFFNWNTDRVGTLRHRRSLDQLRIVAVKNFRSFQIHAGADINFSLSNCVYPDTAISSKIYCQEGKPGYRKTSSSSAYALAQLRLGTSTVFTVAWYSVPFYRFNADSTSGMNDMKSYFGSLDLGARIFLARWVAIDLMSNILFSSANVSNPIDPEFNTQKDWRIKASATFGFSLAKFIQQPHVF